MPSTLPFMAFVPFMAIFTIAAGTRPKTVTASHDLAVAAGTDHHNKIASQQPDDGPSPEDMNNAVKAAKKLLKEKENRSLQMSLVRIPEDLTFTTIVCCQEKTTNKLWWVEVTMLRAAHKLNPCNWHQEDESTYDLPEEEARCHKNTPIAAQGPSQEEVNLAVRLAQKEKPTIQMGVARNPDKSINATVVCCKDRELQKLQWVEITMLRAKHRLDPCKWHQEETIYDLPKPKEGTCKLEEGQMQTQPPVDGPNTTSAEEGPTNTSTPAGDAWWMRFLGSFAWEWDSSAFPTHWLRRHF